MAAKKIRKTGYYWVEYCYAPGREETISRVAFWNGILMHWYITGESRFYYDQDFLSIDERIIKRVIPAPWYVDVLVAIAAAVVIWAAIRAVDTIIFKAVTIW